MRVFLRNRTTRLYCADSSRWAATAEQARDFRSVARAARFARDQKLPAVDIILKCDAPPEEVVMPALPEWCAFDQPPPAVP